MASVNDREVRLRRDCERPMTEIFRKQALLVDRRRSRAEHTRLTALELVTTLAAFLAIALAVAFAVQAALQLSGQ